MPQLGKKVELELDFLRALEKGEVISQMSLSKRLRISVGMVNALVKRAVQKGYVKAKAAPAKRFAYYLTPEGFSQKSKLVAEYIDSSLHFFRDARAGYLEIFEDPNLSKPAKVAIYGGGELAEIAILSAFQAGVNIAAVVDVKSEAGQLCGVPVVTQFSDDHSFNYIVLAEQHEPQKAYDDLQALNTKAEILCSDILGIQK